MSGTGLSLIQDPLTFVEKLGQSFALSQMFGCKTVPQGHVLALHCVMESVSPLTIMQTYHFIEGKLSMRADAMLGKFLVWGGTYRVLSRTADKAEIEAWGKDCDSPVKFGLTWEEAQKEPFIRKKDGGIKDNWNTPRVRMQMLWARVASDMVRTLAPHVVCGAYTPEELEDDHSLVPGAIEGEVVTAPAAQSTVAEPAKSTRTRKTKDTTEAPPTVAPVETVSEVQQKPSETLTTASDTSAAGTPPATAGESIASAVAEVVDVKVEPIAPGLPQIVIDIIQLRDYVGPRWPKDHKNGPWETLWPFVKSRLSFPSGETDEEQITKANEMARNKVLAWLLQQRDVVDKMTGSKDLNTWANQTPQAAK